ncbi:MAG TPA: glycosyltransferase [Bryobacteraceae bacterium]|nr:glycosyltransferase [Bryobacteraceae bacterium]
MKTIDFLYFDAGGGHRAAATALKTVIEQQRRPWDVRLVNLQELLDSLDIFRKITGIRLENIYNLLLAKGWTLGSAQLLVAMHGIIRIYHRGQVRLLQEHWKRAKPDLVVSLVPNFNRAIFESLSAVQPGTRLVTILTDFADYPPHFWMERQPQYFICGTDRAVQQARSLGHSDDRIFRVSGMILRSDFYQPVTVDRASERARLGLQTHLPTGLVLFGGQGSQAMLEIADQLDRAGIDLQLILICGRNERLTNKLKSRKTRIPMLIEGFTPDIPYYMRLSDFFIGKAGPGSISEALHMKLPVIVERNSWTLPQERFNTEWVREKEVGLVVSSFYGVADAVRRLLEPATLARFRQNAGALDNRAVFEIPEILAKLVQ